MYAFKNRNHIKLLFWKLELRYLYKVLYGLDYILPTDRLYLCFGALQHFYCLLSFFSQISAKTPVPFSSAFAGYCEFPGVQYEGYRSSAAS